MNRPMSAMAIIMRLRRYGRPRVVIRIRCAGFNLNV